MFRCFVENSNQFNKAKYLSVLNLLSFSVHIAVKLAETLHCPRPKSLVYTKLENISNLHVYSKCDPLPEA